MSIKVEFSENFKKITENCVKSGAHLGGGNPSAKILFVGQEAAIEEMEGWYESNAKVWQNRILNNEDLITFKRNEKFPSGHTWSQYQKLHNHIFPENVSDKSINFEERIFTTEMNDNPAKKTGEARKKKDFKIHLQQRKNSFFNEDFIQDFPVVVLACSSYIENNSKNKEINEIFKVEYVGDEKGKHWYSRGNWFFLHYNQDETKLVIHTRQLSNRVNGTMLKDMGNVIREHLSKKSIL